MNIVINVDTGMRFVMKKVFTSIDINKEGTLDMVDKLDWH